MIVAKCLENKEVSKRIELIVTPGSRAVKQLIIDKGGYSLLNKSGARISEEVCGACVGQGYSPRSKGVRVATFNRNFCGRSGTKDASVFLVSPEIAAASAVTGIISDPREIFANVPYSRFIPEKYPKINSLFIFNKGNPKTKILRSPNIVKLRKNTPLLDRIDAVVTIKLGDNITTDDITPAGTWLKYRSNIPKYSESVFSEIDPEFSKRASEFKDKGIANIVIAGEGYGEGSSREHAAICPAYLGVKAVISKGFQRIHTDNLVNFGIMPLLFSNPSDYENIEQGEKIIFNNVHSGIRNNRLTLENAIKKIRISLRHELSKRQVEIILVGGALNYLN